MIKPWPFRGEVMEFLLGEFIISSLKWHTSILVATDIFIKWVKATPLKSITQGDRVDKICKGRNYH